MLRPKSFARFITFPENKSAFLAVSDLLARLRSDKSYQVPNLLFLHGPSGTGKSHLVSVLAREVASSTGHSVQLLAAGDFREPISSQRVSEGAPKKQLATHEAPPVPFSLAEEARESDLLILEDLQHLPLTSVETLVQIIDYRQAQQRPSVFTATMGPRHLAQRGVRSSARLTSRLAAGLVVALEPFKPASRQGFLEELAQRNQLALPDDILLWLARSLTGGGRQLEGAISQLETLNKVGRQPLELKTVMAHFSVQVNATKPTVDRIAAQVGGYFRIEPRQLQSRHRYRNVLVARQISMYLARQITPLSLEQIGAYFGGRDHTTVLHACRKVEHIMKQDAVLSGVVGQIHAQLV